MKKKVLNSAQSVTLAVVGGKTLRFGPREFKTLDTEIVNHPDFSQFPDLKVVGNVEEITPFVEVVPEPVQAEETPEIVVVDDKPIEQDEAQDNEVEIKPKRKSQRSNKSNEK